MLPIVIQLNFFLALGTVLLELVTIALLVVFVWMFVTKRTNVIAAQAARFAMSVTFLFTLGASSVTLLYSEVFGFIPCGLCWFERIFLYPHIIIAGGALVMRDRVFAPIYLIGLSVLGAVVALYHHYLQMGGSEFVNCPVSTVSCTQRILFEFNYVTFPFLAFSLFIFVIVLFLVKIMHERTLSASHS
jgi:disulfide bond formation protein DsbB